jgi:small-conductance mechanosensitive channel
MVLRGNNMSEEIKIIEEAPVTTEKQMSLKEEAESFKFFKNCSATLKKLSVAMFVINLFFIIIGVAVGAFVLSAYYGVQIVALLAVPIISVVAIFVIIARLISALIYGFAEIVEKHEK